MKFRRVDIENYGIFSRRQVKFAGDHLHVVFGVNEAGKSTLLQLMREVLFGFPIRNPYVLDRHTGEMAATVEAELADGCRIRYRRRKGRKQAVVGEILETGESFDAERLIRMLGGAGPELFNNVFGFSVQELAAGEKSLTHASVNEALLGSALGGLGDFQKLIKDLSQETDDLFTRTATKRPINQLLSQIRKQEKELRGAQMRPREYEQLRQDADQLQQQVARTRAEYAQLQREQLDLDRMISAIGVWNQLKELREEHRRFSVPREFPIDGDEQFRRAKNHLDQLQHEESDFEAELRDVSDQLTQLRLNPQLLAQVSSIQQLQQQLDKIRGFRRDIVLRQQEATTIRQAVLTRLRDLDPSWGLDQLDRFQATVARRAAVEELATEHDELTRRQSELETRKADLTQDIKVLKQRLSDVDATPVDPVVSQLVDSAADYQANVQRVDDLRHQERAVAATIDAMMQKLAAPFAAELQAIHALPVPMAATIEEHRKRWEAVERDVDRAAQLLQDAQDNVEVTRQKLDQLLTVEDVPDQDQLQAARSRRDVGWRLVRRKYISRQGVAKEEVERWCESPRMPLAEAYELSVAKADGVADQRQEKAEFVARERQLRDELTRAERQAQKLQERWQSKCRDRQACQDEWNRIWQPCGLVPQSPAAMSEWLRLQNDLVDAVQKRAMINRDLESLATSTRQFVTQLRESLGRRDMNATALLAHARQRLEKARDAASARRTYRQELIQKEEEGAALSLRMQSLETERAGWTDRWKPLMREFGFPENWSVHVANRVLSALSETRFDLERAKSLEQRIEDMKNGLDEFDSSVTRLVQEVMPDLAVGTSENAVEELGQHLEVAKQSRRDQVNLADRKSMLNDRLAAKRKQRLDVEQGMQKLLRLAEVDTESELIERAQDVRRWREVGEQVKAREQELRLVCGQASIEDFEAALAAADKTELVAKRETVAKLVSAAEQKFADEAKLLGVAADRLQGLEQVTQAAELAMQLESQRGELRDHIDRWAPLMLAQGFLRRAMERFAVEHQPRLLNEISRLFSQMTLGRYVSVSRKLDEQGTLQLLQQDGECKDPSQLSTGTREQLYLAIRLAYVLQYCQETEPLPLIMDDVLVNFDEQRAIQTVQALNEIARHAQVILLTCHQHTVDLTRSVDSRLEPIRLNERNQQDV
jgi:uncharacterized protein YhaN